VTALAERSEPHKRRYEERHAGQDGHQEQAPGIVGKSSLRGADSYHRNSSFLAGEHLGCIAADLPESKIVGASRLASHGVKQRISKIGMLETIVLLPLSAVTRIHIVLISGLPMAALTGSKASEDTDAEPHEGISPSTVRRTT
jgi:hypothetical protein